jgi:hypothetical protein
MKRSYLKAATIAATIAASAVVFSTSAEAGGMRYLSRKGAWATYVGPSDSGRTICGMQITGRDVALYVKHTPGDPLYIQIFKRGWNIPDGTDIPGYLSFDRDRFTFEGKGGTDAQAGGFITVEIKPGTEDDFLSQMADASKMTVGFTAGTQPPLIADMNGSREAVNVFKWCSSEIDKLAEGAPQPFAKQPTPQPFGDKPVQQQPAVKKRDNGSV